LPKNEAAFQKNRFKNQKKLLICVQCAKNERLHNRYKNRAFLHTNACFEHVEWARAGPRRLTWGSRTLTILVLGGGAEGQASKQNDPITLGTEAESVLQHWDLLAIFTVFSARAHGMQSYQLDYPPKFKGGPSGTMECLSKEERVSPSAIRLFSL